MKQKPLNTPCVGICSTVYGDDVCRGCKRLSPEVIEWNSYDAIQKQKIFNRLNNMITELVAAKIVIDDSQLLRKKLDFFEIRYREEGSPYADVYYLLRAGASQIKATKDFGFHVLTEFKELSLKELFKIIEDEYLALAQRYSIQQAPRSSP